MSYQTSTTKTKSANFFRIFRDHSGLLGFSEKTPTSAFQLLNFSTWCTKNTGEGMAGDVSWAKPSHTICVVIKNHRLEILPGETEKGDGIFEA